MEKIKVILLFLAVLLSANAFAQNDTSTAADRIKKVVKEKLIDKTGIDASTADKVMEITAANRKEMMEIKKQIKDARKYIYDNPESSDISSKLDELMSLDDKLHKTRMDFYTKMKSILTPTQLAKTMSFQKNLSKFMKDEVDKKKKDRKEKRDKMKKEKKEDRDEDSF